VLLFDTNLTVSLEEYTINEEAQTGTVAKAMAAVPQQKHR
jgi:hypothetical protein